MGRCAIVAVMLAACGRIDFIPQPPAIGSPAVIGYVIEQAFQRNDHTIAVVELDPTGVLSERAPFDLGVTPQCVLPNARGTALYASSKDTAAIYTLRIDPATGALSTIGMVGAGAWPFSLSIDPTGRWLYAAEEGAAHVWGYAIGADDTLAPIAGSPWTYAGGSSDYVAIDPSGRWLYAVDDGTSLLYGFAIQPDGSLVVQPALVWSTGDSDPHAAVFDGGGLHGFVAPDLSGGIPGFTLDVATGVLMTTPGSRFSYGADTSEFAAVSPTGDLLFLPFESAPLALDAYHIASDGSLAHVPGSPLQTSNGSIGVAASPLGGFAVFTTGTTVLAISADATAGIALVDERPLASLPFPYQVVLTLVPPSRARSDTADRIPGRP